MQHNFRGAWLLMMLCPTVRYLLEMPTPPDPALDAMTAIIKGWLAMMKSGSWPATDFADLRCVLLEGERSVHGMGEVERPATATDAAKIAIDAIERQLRPPALP